MIGSKLVVRCFDGVILNGFRGGFAQCTRSAKVGRQATFCRGDRKRHIFHSIFLQFLYEPGEIRYQDGYAIHNYHLLYRHYTTSGGGGQDVKDG